MFGTFSDLSHPHLSSPARATVRWTRTYESSYCLLHKCTFGHTHRSPLTAHRSHPPHTTPNTLIPWSTLYTLPYTLYPSWCTVRSAQCSKMNNLLSPKKYFVKSSTYLVISLVKLLHSRNFCQKCVRVNFWSYHSVQCGKTRNSLTEKIFRQTNSFSNFFSESETFTNFLSKMLVREFP